MTDKGKVREQTRIRAQRLRDKRKSAGITTLPVPLAEIEQQKLNEICIFFAWPNKPYEAAEAISALICRVHAEIPGISKKLGSCQRCGENLPQGCAKQQQGGLFKGDAQCWHTLNRVRIFDPTRQGT